MPKFDPSKVYKLPKDIGEIALTLMRGGTEPATAIGSARMLSNNPQDPDAIAFVSDLVRRSEKARDRAANALDNARFRKLDSDDKYNLLNLADMVQTKYRRGLSAGHNVPELTFPARGMGGANRRIIAESALSASEGNAAVFRQNLLDLGFDPSTAEELVRRYTPTIIRQEPDAMGLL